MIIIEAMTSIVKWKTIFTIIAHLGLVYGAGISAVKSADAGGNRGWGLAFSGTDDYASVQGYFPSASYWPTYQITSESFSRVTLVFAISNS
jgi:hypothetical protein